MHTCTTPKNAIWDGHGQAIDNVFEDCAGKLWAGNGEYATQVNYCPFCGYKAPSQIEE